MKVYAVIVEYVPLLREVGSPILNRHNEVLCLIAQGEELEAKALAMRCKARQAVYDLIQRTEQLWSAEKIEIAKNLAVKAVSSSII